MLAQSGNAPRQPVPPFVHFFGGAVGSAVGVTCTCPLEVTKTRMQSAFFREHVADNAALQEWGRAMRAPMGLRTARAVTCIWRQEGFAALFRGLGPSVLGIAPLRAVHFSLYNHIKSQFPAHTRSSSQVHLASALCTGLVTSTLGCPLWVVKTRLQLQVAPSPTPTPLALATPGGGVVAAVPNHKYNSALECARSVWRTEGPSGFFRGLFASYWGISEMALQFVLYERLRAQVVRSEGSCGDGAAPPTQLLLAVAGVSKLAASVVTYPHEVVRTRLREPEWPRERAGSLVGVLRFLYQTEGIGAWYRGLGVHLLRTVPNAALMFTTYELVCSLYSQ